MSNFFKRAITGTLFVAVIICSVWISHWSMLALFLVVIVLGLLEFYSLAEKTGHAPLKIVGTLSGVIIFSSLFSSMEVILNFALILPLIFFIIELYRKKDNPFGNVAYTLLGLIYIVLPFYLMANYSLQFSIGDIHDAPQYYPYVILGVFFLIWANDTFAYLVGSTFGRTKLFESVSPKKTWEGTVGGGIFTLITSYVLSMYFTELKNIDWIIMALIVVVFGSLGDLVKSKLKRSIHVKDSGTILPGHGGIIDRFDSFMFSAPLLFCYLSFFR